MKTLNQKTLWLRRILKAARFAHQQGAVINNNTWGWDEKSGKVVIDKRASGMCALGSLVFAHQLTGCGDTYRRITQKFGDCYFIIGGISVGFGEAHETPCPTEGDDYALGFEVARQAQKILKKEGIYRNNSN